MVNPGLKDRVPAEGRMKNQGHGRADMGEVEVEYEGELRTRCLHVESGQLFLTDAPKDNQGKGEYFSPTDLMGAALGSCILTIMGIYAAKRGLELKGTKVVVVKEMQNLPFRRISKLTLHFTSPHSFGEEIEKRLERIANECPIHKSLHPDLVQEFIFQWGVK